MHINSGQHVCGTLSARWLRVADADSTASYRVVGICIAMLHVGVVAITIQALCNVVVKEGGCGDPTTTVWYLDAVKAACTVWQDGIGQQAIQARNG